MSTLCVCTHDMERHNDRSGADPIVTGWFAGNCRMCKCEAFTREGTGTPVVMATCDKHTYIHIKGWGCPFCYREDFDKKGEKTTLPQQIPEAASMQPPSEGDVNDYDLRHLNSKIDSLQRYLGEIYLLSQKNIEGDKWKAYSDERRLYRVHVMTRKALYDD